MSRWLKLWPFALFLLAYYAFVVANTLGDFVNGPWLGAEVASGICTGLLGVTFVISALVGRHWITGWLIAVLLISLIVLCTFIDRFSTNVMYSSEPLAAVFLVPLLTFSAGLPLMIFRNLWGWTLSFHDTGKLIRQPASLEDLFILGVIAATGVALFGHAVSFLGNPPTGALAFIMLGSFLSGLVIGVPVVYLIYGDLAWSKRRWLWLLFLALASSATLLFNYFAFDNTEINAFIEIPIFWAAIIGTTMLGCAALHWSGVRLAHAERAEPGSTDNAPRAAWYPRLVALGAVGIVTLLSVNQLRVDAQRLAFWTGIKSMLADPASHIADVHAPDFQVTALVANQEFTDDDLARIVKSYPRLNSLSLAGSKVSDAGLDLLYELRELNDLDLSDTAITDAGLQKLRLGYMTSISLAGCQVSLSEALKLAEKTYLRKLDMSRTGITDEQLAAVKVVPMLQNFSLAGNPITDSGLSSLSKFEILSEINLSQTAIDGTGLLTLKSKTLSRVNFDESKITDQTLIAIANIFPLSAVSIQGTAITSAALPTLGAKSLELTLGQGLITEADLLNLSSANFARLRLNDPKFTGQCLTTGKIVCDNVDLSHSSVSAEEIKSMRYGTASVVDLSYTNVPLSALGDLPTEYVVYKGNKLEPAEVTDVANSFMRIIVRNQQLTAQQIVQLRRVHANVDVDGEVPY